MTVKNKMKTILVKNLNKKINPHKIKKNFKMFSSKMCYKMCLKGNKKMRLLINNKLKKKKKTITIKNMTKY